MKIIARYLLAIAVFFPGLVDQVVAQSPYVKGITPPAYPSPNAASLGKYGDIPVSYHTGTPEISIPIYTVTQGSLSLPISLSYHSSGIRVSELASWVGLGWSLNAGGVITRVVHGGPDDGVWQSSEVGKSILRSGWYKDGGIPSQISQCYNDPFFMGKSQQSYLRGPNNVVVSAGCGCSCFEYLWDASQGLIDTEPDLYTFNFNGHSGKFFFDETRKIHMFPEDDFYIKPVTNTNGAFDGWEITSSDGIKYFFGTALATEITKNDPSNAGVWRDSQNTTSWYLYKISSPNGEDQINLSYVDEGYSFGNRGGQSFVINSQNQSLVGDNVNIASAVPSLSVVLGKRLSQITTSSGNIGVNFTGSLRNDVSHVNSLDAANSSAQSLDNIQISAGSICKKFVLGHSYPVFTGNGNCSGCGSSLFDATRLMLNTVQESDCNGISIPPHVFTYNATPLPRRYSLARDRWDFYNGANNQSLIPNDLLHPITGSPLGTADRSANATFGQAGVLTKITYPTGGSTSFSYEPHREIPTSPLIGGLRVTQIVNNDGNGITRTRNIQYGTGYLYSGMPSYLQYPDNNDQSTVTLDFGTIVSASPVQPMWSTQGYHIGYGDVTESEVGNGKTIYRYINSGPMGHPDPSQFPMKELTAGFGTSDLTEKDVHREGEATPFNKEIYSKSIGNTYTTITARKVANIACIPPSPCNPCDCANEPTNNVYGDYNIYTNRFHLNSTDVIKDGMTTHTDYEYGLNLNNPTAITLTNSKNETLRTEWNYPLTAGSGAPAEMYVPTNPNYKNMIAIPLEQREYRNGTIVSKTQNNFTASNGKVLLTQTKQYPTGGTDFISSDYTYNSAFRLGQVNKSDGTNVAMIWGYNNLYAIAQVTNALTSEIFFESFEDQYSGAAQGGRTGNFSVINYSKNLTGLTANKTYTLSYWKLVSGVWQPQSQQVILGASTTQYSISLSGQVDDVRFYPTGSLMTTRTFDHGVGVTSMTDPNNQSTFYSYDQLSRLKLVKDDKGNILKQYKYNYKEQ